MSADDVNNIPFGSPHPGGAQFVFCDGHVSFVVDQINFNVYQDLSDASGGIPTADSEDY